MKDLLCILTFTTGTLLSLAFFSTLKPTAIAAASGGGTGTHDRCSLIAAPTPSCQTSGYTALSWSLAAMVHVAPTEPLNPIR
jgi:hypothetical protein